MLPPQLKHLHYSEIQISRHCGGNLLQRRGWGEEGGRVETKKRKHNNQCIKQENKNEQYWKIVITGISNKDILLC